MGAVGLPPAVFRRRAGSRAIFPASSASAKILRRTCRVFYCVALASCALPAMTAFRSSLVTSASFLVPITGRMF